MRPRQLLKAKKPAAAKINALLRAHGFGNLADASKHLAAILSDKEGAAAFLGIADDFFARAPASPSPDRALLNLERFLANCSAELLPVLQRPLAVELLVRTFSVSQALAGVLIREPSLLEWLLSTPIIDTAKEKSALGRELSAELRARSSALSPQSLGVVRRFKRRELLRIGVRDLMARASLEETTLEVSNLADVCVSEIYRMAWADLVQKHGVPTYEMEEGKPLRAEFCVIGMGKLGGQELNYSSDIDVMYMYTAEGETRPESETAKRRRTDPAPANPPSASVTSISNQQFFTRLAETITRAVGEVTEDGNVFRIDLRLRPEGSSGPIIRTLPSYENYYAQWGLTWERMALIKARCIAGSQHLADEFFEIIQPFRFPRHLSTRIFREIAQIKERIENEIVREERLRRHVKLGIGGIREIEFIAQTIQLLHAGKQPFIQGSNTLIALQKIAQYELLPLKDCDSLREAYRFLRTVEHRLQMEAELQTHTIPDDEPSQLRLARAVGFRTLDGFRKALAEHTSRVRFIYEELLMSEFGGEEARMQELFKDKQQRQKFHGELESKGFRDPDGAIQSLQSLAMGPGYVQVSQRTTELFLHVMPRLLEICRELAAPDDALKQLDRFVEAYGARATLFEMFANNPKLLELFLKLFDRSRFLSEVVLRRPELIEEVTREAIFNRTRPTEQLLKDLRHPAEQRPPRDWLRIFKRAELLRIGLRDILAMEETSQIHEEITALADASVQFALDHARTETKLKSLPFALFGFGKFGGRELGYGADLDVIFVTDDSPQSRDKAGKLASQLIEFLSTTTAEGSVFALDARLRPDGNQGPLVASIGTCESYYAKRAQLWERQSLTRARFVAGSSELRASFEKVVAQHAFGRGLSAAEMAEVLHMRQRVEKERGNQQHAALEFKTGPGGLIDVEFLAQAMQMRHAGKHPELRTPNTREAIAGLGSCKVIDEREVKSLAEGYDFLRKIENALRRVENKPVSAIPAEQAEQQALAKRMGLADHGALMERYRACGAGIREVFNARMV